MKSTTAQEVEKIIDTKLEPVIQRINALETGKAPTPTYYNRVSNNVHFIYDQNRMVHAAISRVIDQLDESIVGWRVWIANPPVSVNVKTDYSVFTCKSTTLGTYKAAEQLAYKIIKATENG